MSERMLAQVMDVSSRVEALETLEDPSVVVTVSNHNVSDPPQDSQLDSAFGTPAAVGEGFIGLVNDEGLNQRVWLCASVGDAWWYVEMSFATEPAD